jgi:hypothetical protein
MTGGSMHFTLFVSVAFRLLTMLVGDSCHSQYYSLAVSVHIMMADAFNFHCVSIGQFGYHDGRWQFAFHVDHVSVIVCIPLLQVTVFNSCRFVSLAVGGSMHLSHIYVYMELLVKPEILTSYVYGSMFGNAESHLYLLHSVSTLNECRKLSCGTVVCKHFASYQGYPNYRWDLIWYAKG